MAKKRLVIANWKTYIEDPKQAVSFVRSLRTKLRSIPGVEVSIAPSFTLVPTLAAALKGSSIRVGAQTISSYDSGAHTGEVTAAMAKKSGAAFALVGHSERRRKGENDLQIRDQLVRAAAAGLFPVLCVGEEERAPDGSHFAVITEQLQRALSGAQPASSQTSSRDGSLPSKLVVAYEPVWAIGKGAQFAMHPTDVREMTIFIKKTLADIVGREAALKVPILHGGSVEPENAAALVNEGGASGLLVGHASTNLDSFVELLKQCNPVRSSKK